MPEVQVTSFTGTIFTKYTKMEDLQKENAHPISIWQFNQIDENNDGKLSEKELRKYDKKQKTFEKMKKEAGESNEITAEYQLKLKQLDEEFAKINADMDEKQLNSFDKLLEMEQKYNISRAGVLNDSEIPEGAYACDIEALCMGILDEKTMNFTGECYKKGYIIFPDNIDEETKNKYIELLNNTTTETKQMIAYAAKCDELSQEYEKYSALIDLVNNGIVTGIKTKEDEDKAYKLYQSVRDISNPFYQQFKAVQQEYLNISRKGNKTEEDYAALIKLRQQMETLQESSAEWSVADLKSEENNSQSFINISGETTFINNSENYSYTTGTSANLFLSEGNFSGNASVGKTTVHTQKPEHKVEENTNAQAQVTYKNDDISASASIMYDNSENTEVLVKSGNLKVNNVAVDVTQTKISQASEDGNFETKSTTAGLNYYTGIFSNRIEHTDASEGSSTTISSGMNLPLISSDDIEFSLEAGAAYSYFERTNLNTFSPEIATTLSFGSEKGNNLHGTLRLHDRFDKNFQRGIKLDNTNTFDASATVQRGNLSAGLNFSNMESGATKTTAYGMSLGFKTKAGNITGKYSHSNSSMFGQKTKEDKFSLTYTAQINNPQNNDKPVMPIEEREEIQQRTNKFIMIQELKKVFKDSASEDEIEKLSQDLDKFYQSRNPEERNNILTTIYNQYENQAIKNYVLTLKK